MKEADQGLLYRRALISSRDEAALSVLNGSQEIMLFILYLKFYGLKKNGNKVTSSNEKIKNGITEDKVRNGAENHLSWLG